ncbi:Wall-associated receptor kinase [Macleaya cordata]|uniref:Wall-associated receptor kinase n=1 Tax=Macleaya cordata TaxID=56857 RepID=A0A200QM84_MACCD|nr:Wall-associated receptor kinase [Macleaya cordata]
MAVVHALLIFHSFLLVLSCWVQLAAADDLQPITGTKPGCPEKCGNVSIPYPFGVGDGCYIEEAFSITCNHTFNHPKPFFGELNFLNISVREGEIEVILYMAIDCYNDNLDVAWASATSGKFTFSDTRNKFTAIGCDTVAIVGGRTTGSYGTGCMSLCGNVSDVINGSCTGLGCCQSSIPKGLVSYNVSVSSFGETRMNLSFNPCSYAFLSKESWFNFSSADLKEFSRGENGVPAVLEWTIGEQNCDQAKRNSTTPYACGPNTDCYEPGNAPGYRCKCKDGYEGNPYLTSTGRCQEQ